MLQWLREIQEHLTLLARLQVVDVTRNIVDGTTILCDILATCVGDEERDTKRLNVEILERERHSLVTRKVEVLVDGEASVLLILVRHNGESVLFHHESRFRALESLTRCVLNQLYLLWLCLREK